MSTLETETLESQTSAAEAAPAQEQPAADSQIADAPHAPAWDADSLDAYVATLKGQKDVWAHLPVSEKFHHIMEMRRRLSQVAERWVQAVSTAKGLPKDSPLIGEEWASGPWSLAHGLNRYADTFYALDHGEDLLEKAGEIRARKDGQTIVDVAPINGYENLFLNGVRAEVWMEPGVTQENLRERMAGFYQQAAPAGKVALVLGAGNVSGIAPMDVLQKLFTEGQVCILKMNPVNEYLLPIFEEIFESLIAYGFLRIAGGGADAGAFLVDHADIDEIHMTGSTRTHDLIVYGPGEEGARRKAENKPRNTKRITSELGNVSPTIVLPGDWSEADLRFQAENIVTQKLHNGGFNCVAAQVLIVPKAWDKTPYLLGEIRRLLRTLPARPAYYPGAVERVQRFAEEHGRVESIGQAGDGIAPRIFITQVDPEDVNALCFREEAFGTVLSQTSLPGADAASFFRNALTFANESLTGTLGANIIVDPKTLKKMGHDFEDLIAELRYGAIGVNIWAGSAFSLSQTAWGAFPGHEPQDIQSGVGKVHNAFLFDAAQKTVVYGPFRPFPRSVMHGEWTLLPKPPWFVTNKTSAETFKRLTYFELNPGVQHLPGVVYSAMRGNF